MLCLYKAQGRPSWLRQDSHKKETAGDCGASDGQFNARELVLTAALCGSWPLFSPVLQMRRQRCREVTPPVGIRTQESLLLSTVPKPPRERG